VKGRGLLWFELVVPDHTALDGVRERFTAGGVDTTPNEDGFDVTDRNDIITWTRVDE
jgi:catechol 2,3-dioxygenase